MVYLFGGFFSDAFVGIYVTIILLVSMDFWTVKNVTGRLMVGLRWWNFIDEEGVSHWVFENRHLKENDKMMSGNDMTTGDAGLFWAGLVVQPVVWSLLFMVSILRFNVQYMMIVSLALVLSSSNLYGYLRCRMGSTDVKAAATHFIGKHLLFNYMTSLTKKDQPIYPSA